MSNHPQDKKTQTAASAGATSNDATLASNAAQNQEYANQTRKSLFGTPDASGKYQGGSESQFLDPAALNQNGLTGSYKNAYANEANAVANNTKNAVGTTMQSMANRGMGKSPAGFGADQMRKAYQDQSATLGNLYSGAAGQQHSDALDQFNKANSMLNANASQTANLSVQGNQAAAGNYASLYGTSSQQQPSGWAVAGNTLANMGQPAATGYACPARGSYYLMHDGTQKLVEDLVVGDELEGGDGEPQTVEEIATSQSPVLRICTDNGCVVRNSRVHAFALPWIGFVVASKAMGKVICTAKGVAKVISIEPDGIDEVFNVITDGSHTYCADGVWALGVGEAERYVNMETWNHIGDSIHAEEQ